MTTLLPLLNPYSFPTESATITPSSISELTSIFPLLLIIPCFSWYLLKTFSSYGSRTTYWKKLELRFNGLQPHALAHAQLPAGVVTRTPLLFCLSALLPTLIIYFDA